MMEWILLYLPVLVDVVSNPTPTGVIFSLSLFIPHCLARPIGEFHDQGDNVERYYY
jgi:hypothetical protein